MLSISDDMPNINELKPIKLKTYAQHWFAQLGFYILKILYWIGFLYLFTRFVQLSEIIKIFK